MERSLRIPNQIAKADRRQFILTVENEMKKRTDICFNGSQYSEMLTHRFSEGIYIRECPIAAGALVIGRIHKHDHPVFLVKGRARVLTESGGVEELSAPYYGISPAGTKRLLMTHVDCVFVTVHSNPDNCRDIAELEKRIAVDEYSQLQGAA